MGRAFRACAAAGLMKTNSNYILIQLVEGPAILGLPRHVLGGKHGHSLEDLGFG